MRKGIILVGGTGSALSLKLLKTDARQFAIVFRYKVKNPQRFDVADLDPTLSAAAVIEQ